jgi:hypothetical protein
MYWPMAFTVFRVSGKFIYRWEVVIWWCSCAFMNVLAVVLSKVFAFCWKDAEETDDAARVAKQYSIHEFIFASIKSMLSRQVRKSWNQVRVCVSLKPPPSFAQLALLSARFCILLEVAGPTPLLLLTHHRLHLLSLLSLAHSESRILIAFSFTRCSIFIIFSPARRKRKTPQSPCPEWALAVANSMSSHHNEEYFLWIMIQSVSQQWKSILTA